MRRIRLSSVALGAAFLLLLTLLLILRSELWAAHQDETIHYLASDAATYFSLYEGLYAEADLAENPALFVIGSPILFMKLSNGNLFLIQICNLALMAISMKVAFGCLPTFRGRMAFMAGAFAFPYFLFGFLSLNKEVYAMCSAIFFASYMVRGKWAHLLAALLLAACARYYMLIALLSLLVLVPRDGRPRYRLIVALLVCISIAAPLLKSVIPGYSAEELLEDSGAVGLLFSKIVDSFGYALIYPIKYLALIPMRAYGLLIGSGRTTDVMEGVVSITSLALLLLALRIVRERKPTSPVVSRLIVAAFVAPIPIMWSEIMHWRYYSFVYFFLLFAVVLHFVEGRRSPPLQRHAVSHA